MVVLKIQNQDYRVFAWHLQSYIFFSFLSRVGDPSPQQHMAWWNSNIPCYLVLLPEMLMII